MSWSVGLHEEPHPPLRKPIYKRNSSSTWVIHSLISYAKKEEEESQRRKCEEDKDKDVKVFGSLSIILEV